MAAEEERDNTPQAGIGPDEEVEALQEQRERLTRHARVVRKEACRLHEMAQVLDHAAEQIDEEAASVQAAAEEASRLNAVMKRSAAAEPQLE